MKPELFASPECIKKVVMGSDPNVVQLSKYRYFNSVSAFERGAIFLTFFPQEG
jgi:hypothetical protein